MPTKTFFHLPLEKQKKLLEAGEREFSRVDFSLSSINRIIQDAGISRGSFYMYFEDKEDLYFYILEKYMTKTYHRLLKNIEKCRGDFIQAFELLYETLIESCFTKEKGELFKNVFLNMRFTTEKKIKLKPPKDVIRKNHQEILNYIDKTLYNYQSEEELFDIFSLVMLVTMSSVAYTLINPLEKDREKTNYRRRLEIIRTGILRRKDNNV